MNYREILKTEYESRRQANSRYLQRAFAGDLGLSPTRVSDLLLRRQGLSPKTAGQIVRRLHLSPERAEVFCALVRSEHARSAKEKAEARTWVARFMLDPDRILSHKWFHLISDWYPLAILEMMRLKNFDPSTKVISRRLGISVEQAKDALDRLQELFLIQKKNGKLVCRDRFLATS